jgi:hypothetical protein
MTAEIDVSGPENISVPAGKFEALRLDCQIKRKRALRPPISLRLWLSHDDARLPLKGEVKLAFGSATLVLASKSNAGKK